jgi:hypothetical protein
MNNDQGKNNETNISKNTRHAGLFNLAGATIGAAAVSSAVSNGADFQALGFGLVSAAFAVTAAKQLAGFKLSRTFETVRSGACVAGFAIAAVTVAQTGSPEVATCAGMVGIYEAVKAVKAARAKREPI